jgi:hypothetical protein
LALALLVGFGGILGRSTPVKKRLIPVRVPGPVGGAVARFASATRSIRAKKSGWPFSDQPDLSCRIVMMGSIPFRPAPLAVPGGSGRLAPSRSRPPRTPQYPAGSSKSFPSSFPVFRSFSADSSPRPIIRNLDSNIFYIKISPKDVLIVSDKSKIGVTR